MDERSADIAPVAVFFYNRPNKLSRLWERLQQVKPQKIYLIADGPNPGKQHDYDQCSRCREIVSKPDWPCQVFSLFRDRNLGCKRSVVEGLKWVFSHEPCAIILEDDCIPAISFFRYATALLHQYSDDDRVMAISGRRIHAPDDPENNSYLFSRYALIHGWATWAQTIEAVDWELGEWETLRSTDWLFRELGNPTYVAFWTWVFDRMRQGWDTWDYALAFAMFRKQGLCAIPSVNLVENIGYDSDGSNTLDQHPGVSDRKASDIGFPLFHPQKVETDKSVDDQLEWLVHSGLVHRQMGIARRRMKTRGFIEQ